VDIEKGVYPEQTERLATYLGFGDTPEQLREASEQMQCLYELFINVDSTQVEVNPLALTRTGQSTIVYCISTRICFSSYDLIL
jgi:succinyl-CoA synthetase beta subunit